MGTTSQLFKRTGIALTLSFSASLAFAGSIAKEQVDSGGVTLVPTVQYDSATLRVSSNNTDQTLSFSSSESIRFDSGALPDDVYQYELALVSIDPEGQEGVNSSSVTQNGSFEVTQGVSASTFEDKKTEPVIQEVFVPNNENE